MPGPSSTTAFHVTSHRRVEAPKPEGPELRHFAGKVAHDYNNYLTAFLGYGELLEGLLDEEGKSRRYLREMIQAAQRARVFTQQLQAFSGRQILDVRPWDLNDLIRGCREQLGVRLPTGVELAVELEPALHLADVDPGQFELVILALAEDAARSMEEGGTLRLGTANGSQDGSEEPVVEVTLSDTRPCASGDEGDRYFRPFPEAVGHRVGMCRAAAQGIVLQHGGWIDLQSAPEGGRRLRILLPARV